MEKYPLFSYMNTPNQSPMDVHFKAQKTYPANDLKIAYNLSAIAGTPEFFTSKIWDDYHKLRKELFAPLEHIAFELWYHNVSQSRLALNFYNQNCKSICIDGIEVYKVEIEETLNEATLTLTRKFAGFIGDGEAIFNKLIEEYSNE